MVCHLGNYIQSDENTYPSKGWGEQAFDRGFILDIG
jgi:hypothetical protein